MWSFHWGVKAGEKLSDDSLNSGHIEGTSLLKGSTVSSDSLRRVYKAVSPWYSVFVDSEYEGWITKNFLTYISLALCIDFLEESSNDTELNFTSFYFQVPPKPDYTKEMMCTLAFDLAFLWNSYFKLSWHLSPSSIPPFPSTRNVSYNLAPGSLPS